jgi:hypothetical protein
VDRIQLPTNRRFESRTEWVATSLVVPTAPDFLPEREVANVRAHQEHLEDIYEQWDAESMDPDFAAPRTTTQLIRQLEASAHTRRWMLGGFIGGLITLVAVVASLCVTRKGQMIAFLRRRGVTPKIRSAVEPVERQTPTEGASADPPLHPQEREHSAEEGAMSRYPTSVFQR